MDPFLKVALDEARTGRLEGGIPIGSVLVYRDEIIGRGHNRRVQRGSPCQPFRFLGRVRVDGARYAARPHYTPGWRRLDAAQLRRGRA
jgi:hypothetical protein